MGAVESDSVKPARKAKDKLHKARERASETRERTLHGQEQNNAHGKHERVTRQRSISSQHTSTITCTAAPRVWHFSAFHSQGIWSIIRKFAPTKIPRYTVTYAYVSMFREALTPGYLCIMHTRRDDFNAIIHDFIL